MLKKLKQKILLFLFVLWSGYVVLLNESNASYQFININNNLITFLSGEYNFSYYYNFNKEIVSYQTRGVGDKVSTVNVSRNLSTKLVADSSFLHTYGSRHFLALTLGGDLNIDPYWIFKARLRTIFSGPTYVNLYPSIYFSHKKLGDIEYNVYKKSAPSNIGFSVGIGSLLSTANSLSGSSLTYSSPEIDLKNENLLKFRISYVFNPNLNIQKGNFTDSSSYKITLYKGGYVSHTNPYTYAYITSNYSFYINYSHIITNLHTLVLAVNYDLVDYQSYSTSYSYDAGKNYGSVLGDVREKFFRISIGYEYGEFKLYYINGSTNATNEGKFYIVSKNKKSNVKHLINPKLSGSLHVFKISYSPYILKNKLIFNSSIELYHDKVTNNNKPFFLPINGVNASVKGHSAKRYSLSITYKLHKNVSLSLTSAIELYNTDFLTVTGGKYYYQVDKIFNRLSLLTTF